MKQKGKPRGYFENVLAFDAETTGLCFKNYENNENPVYNPATGERHQAVSWGFAIVDADTLKIKDELYLEIKWNEHSIAQQKKNPKFGQRAGEIHGLTKKYLDEHGLEEEEAVMKIANFIMPYFGTDNAIKTLGHNSHLFDIPFLRDLFQRHGIKLKFGSRHFDSNSLSFGTVKAWNSDDLFATMGYEHRKEHNALEDVKLTVEMFRIIRLLWKKKVGLLAYED